MVDGAGDELLGVADGREGVLSPGQAGCDGGGEDAAAAVGVAGRGSRCDQLLLSLAVEVGVDGQLLVGVAPFDDDGPRPQLEDVPRRLPSLLGGSDGAAEQDLGLGQVRRRDSSERQQSRAEGGHRLLVEEPGATLGDHHRVDHQQRDPQLLDRTGDDLDDLGAGQHAGLGGVRAEVRDDGVDLRPDQRDGQRQDLSDAEGVLGGDGRDRRGAVDSQRGEGLEVGLDAGSTPGVGARDGQRDRELHAVRSRRSPR